MVRNSRSFVDLDAAFTRNPRTRDVATRVDDAAIRGAIRNLIYTRHYERPFQPGLGCQLHNLLFENFDNFTRIVIERTIRDALDKHEPRIQVLGVQITEAGPNDINIQVEYRIRNTEVPSVFTTTFTRVR